MAVRNLQILGHLFSAVWNVIGSKRWPFPG